MKTFALVIAVLICLQILWHDENTSLTVLAKKNKKKGKSKGPKNRKPKRPPKNPEVSSPERPTDINEYHYCFVCLQMADFAMGALKTRDSEVDIV